MKKHRREVRNILIVTKIVQYIFHVARIAVCDLRSIMEGFYLSICSYNLIKEELLCKAL